MHDMATNVDQAIAEYMTRLTPLDTETEAARSHRASIETRLKQTMGMTAFFRSGSFGFGTSVRGSSDVDYFAVFAADRLNANSNMSLNTVAAELKARFPNSGVAVDSPAVRVPFGSTLSERHEIVPAWHQKTVNNIRLFGMPNRIGGWMNASPEAHSQYVDRVNQKHGGKVKPLIRLIKSWKYHCDVPIRSFYLENAVALWADSQASIVYSYDIFLFLCKLDDLRLADLNDPSGVSNVVSACDASNIAACLQKIATARRAAGDARACHERGDVRGTLAAYDKVFGGKFPGYY